MSNEHFDDEDTQRVELRRLLAAVDVVPPEVVAAAKGSLAWLTIDADLASLAFDSSHSTELVGTRGDSGPRSVSFEYRELSIELEISPTRNGSSVTGQVAPVAPAAIELTRADGTTQTAAPDTHGRFALDAVRSGNVRLLLRFAAGEGPAQLLTEWITI